MAVLSNALLSGEAAKARAPISSRFLCPQPPLLITLRAQQKNRHATQATQLPLKKIEERDPFFSEGRGHLYTGYIYSFSKSN